MRSLIIRKELSYDLMVLPGMILLIVFGYLPMLGIITAFKDYTFATGLLGSKWIGFENFITFFNDPYFLRVLKNTLFLGFFTLLITFPMPIILSILFSEIKSRKFKKLAQTATYLPYFVSTVIIVGIMKTLFDQSGLINVLINSFGLEGIQFFNNPQWFRPLYILSILWQNTGYGAIIYLAAIAGIDQEIYEACHIDGANRWQVIWKITLPSISPTIITMLILAVGSIVGTDFERVYLMYSPLIYDTADVIATYTYRSGIMESRIGYATAVGLFNSVISLILVWSANQTSKKVSDTNLW